MLEVYKPHTNREAVGVWLCSAAKRPRMRSPLRVGIGSTFHNPTRPEPDSKSES